MERRVLAEFARGPASLRVLARRLRMPERAVKEEVERLVAAGIVRASYDECPAHGCLFCRHHRRCEDRPARRFELGAPARIG